MCRWLAYSGSPIVMKEVLDGGTTRSLTKACTRGSGPRPPTATGSASAGTAPPTRELADHISSPLFFTISARRIGSAVQQTNCHPFRHDRWLFMHNGYINEFATIKRDLILAVDSSLYPEIQGQADTEVLFYLALTFGLEDDPPAAVERAVGLVEAVASRHGVPHPFQGTIATTDGEIIWALRYSSEHKSRTLFYTTDVPTLRKQHPEMELLQEFSENARLIVSEPLGKVAADWNEIPESTYGVVSHDHPEKRPSNPKHRLPRCPWLSVRLGRG
jgi:predicted glutamine amidotransferase